jgi:hypothetical protein
VPNPALPKSASPCPKLAWQSPTKSAADTRDRQSAGFNLRTVVRAVDLPKNKILRNPVVGAARVITVTSSGTLAGGAGGCTGIEQATCLWCWAIIIGSSTVLAAETQGGGYVLSLQGRCQVGAPRRLAVAHRGR